MHSHRCGHRLVDDIVDDPRRLGCAGAQRTSYPRLDGAFRQRRVQAHATTGKTFRIQIAKHQVGVRYGRLLAAEAIASRSWISAGTLRPHLDDAERVDPRNASSAGADLDHV